MRLVILLLFVLLSNPSLANEPTPGELISEKLSLGSSGILGPSEFVSLPKGQWKVLEVENLSSSHSLQTHRGFFLESQRKDAWVPLVVVIVSKAANVFGWPPEFSAVPIKAEGANQYGTSVSSLLSRQSFYFRRYETSGYQQQWLHEVKVGQKIGAEYSRDSFALSVTRSISKNQDICVISFIRKPRSLDGTVLPLDDRFISSIKKWNDALVRATYDSFYEAKTTSVSEVNFEVDSTFRSSEGSGELDEATPSSVPVPGAIVAASQPAAPSLEPEALKEREARLMAELELERLKSQLRVDSQNQQATSNINGVFTNTGGSGDAQNKKPSSVMNQRLALVVGNDKYKNVPKLQNAVGDSKAISSLLSGLGYEVLMFYDLNEKQFKGALRQFKQRLKGGEEVVFFFAGHGVQIGSANYLLPTDVGSDNEEQIRDEGIPLQRVLDDFSESKVKFSLAMVDACRDNPFKSTGRSIGGRGLAATSAATGQMIIFSAGTGQQALDRLGTNDKARNGLFTRVLIEKVSQSKEPIHILMRDVRAEVAKLAQSIGHEQVPAIYDQVIGDFYFVPKK